MRLNASTVLFLAKVKIIAFAILVLIIPSTAMAKLIIDIFEDGNDVRVDYTGSINTSGLTFDGVSAFTSSINPNSGQMIIGGSTVNGDLYRTTQIFDSLVSFGVGGFQVADIFYGSRIAITDADSGVPGVKVGKLALPVGYVSGTMISGGMTFLNESFLSMGIDTTFVSYELLNGDSININSAIAVPEPNILWLILLGVATFMVLKIKSNQVNTAGPFPLHFLYGRCHKSHLAPMVD